VYVKDGKLKRTYSYLGVEVDKQESSEALPTGQNVQVRLDFAADARVMATAKRLNRGGNREANHALWRIVITRMSAHPATRAYVERRTAEGLSKKEIIRCLKRYVAREVYPYLRG